MLSSWRTLRLVWLAGPVLMACADRLNAAAAEQKSTAPAPAAPLVLLDPAPPPQSVFNHDLSTGTDPFFPKSNRRPKPASTNIEPATANPIVPDAIVLQGISISKKKRLALINNRPFEAGEEGLIRLPNEAVRVRCEAIRTQSVIVSVKGVTKELALRKGS